MKTILLLILLIPLASWAQLETTEPSLTPKPYGDTLKPIEFREIPYMYTTSSTSTYRGRRHTTYYNHAGIKRIYSYDGIDIDEPEKELWRYMVALGNDEVERQRLQFEDIVSRKQTANSIGVALFIPGLIMLLVSGAEASAYKKALSQQQQAYYSAPVPPSYISKTCTNWSGSPDGSGTYTWTCSTDPSLTYKGSSPPYTVQVPVTTPGKTYPTTVDKPNGVGIGVAGLATMLVGMIVYYSASGDQHSTFLKAVQYYNRALKQKFSWEIKPYLKYNLSGVSIVGHF